MKGGKVMKRIAYKMVWMISVFAMLLINNSVLFAQSTEETTTIIQSGQDQIDIQQQATTKTYYLFLKSLKCNDTSSEDWDYVNLKVNGTFIWGEYNKIDVGDTLDISTSYSVSSRVSIDLYLTTYPNTGWWGSKKGTIRLTSSDLNNLVDKGEQTFTVDYLKFYRGYYFSYNYKLTYEVRSTYK